MNCPICRDLERAFAAGLSEYLAARTSVSFRVCTKLAAQNNVEMERARYELEEHRALCVPTARVFAILPERGVRDISTSARQRAA
jgi:hypothetical protein